MLDDRVYHIDYVPATPEPYYQSTGRELQPRPVGEENGQVVYNYYPISAVNYVRFFSFCIRNPHFSFISPFFLLLFRFTGTLHNAHLHKNVREVGFRGGKGAIWA